MKVPVSQRPQPLMEALGILVPAVVAVPPLFSDAPPAVKAAMLAIGIATALLFFIPRRYLAYELVPEGLRIRTMAGQTLIRRSDVRSATAVDYRLRLRWFGVAAVAYYVGDFSVHPTGTTQVFAGEPAGRGVLVVTQKGRKILLSPEDPDVLLRALQEG